MNSVSIVVAIMGFMVFTFSLWGFLIIKKHISKFNSAGRVSKGLSDEKYQELKARQDYIVATSAVLFAVISFIGVKSISDIKSDLQLQFTSEKSSLDSLYQLEKTKMDSLNKSASETNEKFSGLKIEGNSLQDSMRSAMNLVSGLKDRVSSLYEKDIVKQNLFIVENLLLNSFPISRYKGENYRYVSFKNLKSISGQKLPTFYKPPSVLIFTSDGSAVTIDDITSEGFRIFAVISYAITTEQEKDIDTRSPKFSLWISQSEGLQD